MGTLKQPMFPSYRNKSTDLQCKSIGWFLYKGNIVHLRVKLIGELVPVPKYQLSTINVIEHSKLLLQIFQQKVHLFKQV